MSEMMSRLNEVRERLQSQEEAVLQGIQLSIHTLQALKTARGLSESGKPFRQALDAFMLPMQKEFARNSENFGNMQSVAAIAFHRQVVRAGFNKLGVGDGVTPPMMPLMGGQENPLNGMRAEILGMDDVEYYDLVEAPIEGLPDAMQPFYGS